MKLSVLASKETSDESPVEYKSYLGLQLLTCAIVGFILRYTPGMGNEDEDDIAEQPLRPHTN